MCTDTPKLFLSYSSFSEPAFTRKGCRTEVQLTAGPSGASGVLSFSSAPFSPPYLWSELKKNHNYFFFSFRLYLREKSRLLKCWGLPCLRRDMVAGGGAERGSHRGEPGLERRLRWGKKCLHPPPLTSTRGGKQNKLQIIQRWRGGEDGSRDRRHGFFEKGEHRKKREGE